MRRPVLAPLNQRIAEMQMRATRFLVPLLAFLLGATTSAHATSVSPMHLEMASVGHAGRSQFTVANTGNGVICAEIGATLNTTFSLQYHRGGVQTPRVREMLPGESAKGAYTFDIKDGVKPLEIIFRLGNSVRGIRCASAGPTHDAVIPDEIRLDVRDFPVKPPLPTFGQVQ